MSGGIVYDLYALAVAAFVVGVVFLIALAVRLHHRAKPYDWEKQAPEYRCAKDAHVKVVGR